MPKAKLTRRERDQRRAAANDQVAAAASFPEQPADDMDAFRLMLARRINIFISNRQRRWRGCPEPACRRRRGCVAPRIECANHKRDRPSTPEQRARGMARVQRTLRDVSARREAEEKLAAAAAGKK